MKNPHIGKTAIDVVHTKASNEFLTDLFLMNECNAINVPIVPAHLIALMVKGYLKMYFAFR